MSSLIITFPIVEPDRRQWKEGTFGDDVLVADDADGAILEGLDGSDRLVGFVGPDWILGDVGDDVLEGDAGADTLEGGGGDDEINGGGDVDVLKGGYGDDVLMGGAGDDQLFGGDGYYGDHDGDDLLIGGDGFDVADWNDRNQAFAFHITGGGMSTAATVDEIETDQFTGIERIIGTNLDDVFLIEANAAPDTGGWLMITPDGGDDLIVNLGAHVIVDFAEIKRSNYVGDFYFQDQGIRVDLEAGTVLANDPSHQYSIGVDVLIGIQGVRGSRSSDQLLGTAGDDFLIGADGYDVLEGREGDDILSGGDDAHISDGGAGYDMVDYFDLEEGVRVELAHGWTQAGDGRETLISIEGAAGSDFDDVITGDRGANYLAGRDGDDKIYGGHGLDVIEGDAGRDVLFGEAGADEIAGGDGADRICGGGGDDSVDGGAGADAIMGDAGADVLDGGADNDRLFGGSGDDILIGGDGADFLDGSGGADVYAGGAGADRLSSRLDGAEDWFVFDVGGGSDRVYRYEAGVDRIALSAEFGFADGADAIQSMVSATLDGDAVLNLNGTDFVRLVGFARLNPGVALADLADDIVIF